MKKLAPFLLAMTSCQPSTVAGLDQRPVVYTATSHRSLASLEECLSLQTESGVPTVIHDENSTRIFYSSSVGLQNMMVVGYTIKPTDDGNLIEVRQFKTLAHIDRYKIYADKCATG